MASTSDAYRKEVAHRVRKLAWGWSMHGLPEPMPAMRELMEALLGYMIACFSIVYKRNDKEDKDNEQ